MPGYFVISTSGAETPLWAVDNSQYYLQQYSRLWPHLSKALVARKVVVLPYSILIRMGDLQYTGAADIDHSNQPVQGCPRYHIFVVPYDRQLVDGIYFTTGFTPDFVDEVPEAEEEERDDGSSGDGKTEQEENGFSS